MTIIKILPAQYSQNKAARQMRSYRKRHPEYALKDTRIRKERRLLIMDYLGGRKCSNCGFSDIRALVLDHINGGGHQLRLQGSLKMYTYYYRNPDVAKKDLQVLCANCNAIKQVEKKEYAFAGGVRGNGRETKHIENSIYHTRQTTSRRKSQS